MLPAHGSSAQQESGKDSCTHGRLCSQVLCSQSAILGQPAPPGEGKTLSLSTMRVRSISNCFPSRAVVPPVLSFTQGCPSVPPLPPAPASPRLPLAESLSRRDCQRWSALNLRGTKPGRALQQGPPAPQFTQLPPKPAGSTSYYAVNLPQPSLN